MATLDSGLRNTLDATIGKARDEAERAAARALTTLAVNHPDAFVNLSDDGRRLRNQLRAKARQLGDRERMDARQELSREWALVRECAYEHWHRMLFARFLAENRLLIYPEANVPVSLADCAQIATAMGLDDPWLLVTDYAARMLPGIFRADDPLLRVTLAAEGRQALERLLESIPHAVFISEDALGWVYQFWQSRRKEEINAADQKIAGADISPVTQLFTEPYMVQFLLQNTLGAWWAARHPNDPLVDQLTYLRRRDDGIPAAGTFDDWPPHAAEVTVMDPCCGSGHFLVAAFDLLRRMRETEEGLTPAEASAAVLRDNIHGLEIDSRCTQIAAFALVLAAWKVSGFTQLPIPNVACSGTPIGGRLYEWIDMANGDAILEMELRRLHELFSNAPDLGSLIDPAHGMRDNLFAHSNAQLQAALSQALRRGQSQTDPVKEIFGVAAEGLVRAEQLLTSKYHLVATNVPYLQRSKQGVVLRKFCEQQHRDAQENLATAFMERCNTFCVQGGTVAVVTIQNWLFLGRYARLRQKLLTRQSWQMVVRLGTRAFRTPMWDFNIALVIMSNRTPSRESNLIGIDGSTAPTPTDKTQALLVGDIHLVDQLAQLKNPDARISFGEVLGGALLGEYATSPRGIVSGDTDLWIRLFWEASVPLGHWKYLQSTVQSSIPFGGRESIINWSTQGKGMLRPGLANPAYNRRGVALRQMGNLPCTLYTGELYDNNTAVICPNDPAHLPAIWAFCQSDDFIRAVRNLDQKLNVTNATLVKVPFDLDRWQAVADAAGPLPEPHSDDPTQWLFHGHPARSTEPLQVALARLLGYRWPQNEEDGLRRFADEDGIVCLPPIAGEPPAADRLRAILAAAYGDDWSPATLERLLAGVGFGGKGLDSWLRDGAGFFKQHCALFHNRPFLWQIWDGRRDGFSAIVNYHGLDGRKLDRLIYTYLGAWIAQQRQDAQAGVTGADLRLGAAQALQRKLEAIREGEASADGKSGLDIYVRWKPLDRQPIGWEPDLNDGVRLNVRPFVTADVLRAKFTVNWNKDRGTNPDGSARENDKHLTRAEKEAARRQGARA